MYLKKNTNLHDKKTLQREQVPIKDELYTTVNHKNHFFKRYILFLPLSLSSILPTIHIYLTFK